MNSLHRTLLSPAPPGTTDIRRCCPSERLRLELLSWGFPKMPLRRDPGRASTPGRFPVLRPEDASLVLVPSLPFLPASTVFSARPPQVCCTLHPTMGFGPFQAPPLSLPRDNTSDLYPPLNRASHPSEPSPRLQPYRVTAALAFSPFERLTREVLQSQGFSPSPSPLSRSPLPPITTRCSPGLRSPPGSSPNTLWPIQNGDPKISRSLAAEPPVGFAMYTTWRPSKALQRNPVAFFLPALAWTASLETAEQLRAHRPPR